MVVWNVNAGIAYAGKWTMFIAKCPLRKEHLPAMPCDCIDCDWYIRDSTYNNCFWILAYYLDIQPGLSLSFDEIARLEQLSLDEVIYIFNTALTKLQKESNSFRENY